jgi:hypothetical protein
VMTSLFILVEIAESFEGSVFLLAAKIAQVPSRASLLRTAYLPRGAFNV